ncbi:MAG TPA: hypothetical protein DCQ37_21380 [Desulfobacteraceae bacterium]|nr:hypothetical protein [Desulfobacteraceae bacterium]
MRKCRVIPPGQNAESVANMEDIPELYSREYDAGTPVICTDGQPRQLIAETGKVIPPEPGKPGRADYEYERNGTAEIFMFTEPLSGWRHVSVRKCRTGIDCWKMNCGRLSNPSDDDMNLRE